MAAAPAGAAGPSFPSPTMESSGGNDDRSPARCQRGAGRRRAHRARRTRPPDDEAKRSGGVRRANHPSHAGRAAAGQTETLPLVDAVAARGGSIRFTVDPGDVRFYIEALADDAPAVLDLFRTALAAPDFSPATIRDARDSLVRQIARIAAGRVASRSRHAQRAPPRRMPTPDCRSWGRPTRSRSSFRATFARSISDLLSTRRRDRERGRKTRRARTRRARVAGYRTP